MSRHTMKRLPMEYTMHLAVEILLKSQLVLTMCHLLYSHLCRRLVRWPISLMALQDWPVQALSLAVTLCRYDLSLGGSTDAKLTS